MKTLAAHKCDGLLRHNEGKNARQNINCYLYKWLKKLSQEDRLSEGLVTC